MAIQLPGGRGQLTGANAPSLVGEQLRTRSKELPEVREYFQFTYDIGAASYAGTAGRFLFFAEGLLEFDLEVDHLYAKVSGGAAAGRYGLFGLYSIDTQSHVARLIPATTVRVDGSVAAYKDSTLPRHLHLPKGMCLGLGFLQMGGGNTWVSGYQHLRTIYYQNSMTALPEVVDCNTMSPTHSYAAPRVMLASNRLAGVF